MSSSTENGSVGMEAGIRLESTMTKKQLTIRKLSRCLISRHATAKAVPTLSPILNFCIRWEIARHTVLPIEKLKKITSAFT